jgi:hypothetical protein
MSFVVWKANEIAKSIGDLIFFKLKFYGSKLKDYIY